VSIVIEFQTGQYIDNKVKKIITRAAFVDSVADCRGRGVGCWKPRILNVSAILKYYKYYQMKYHTISKRFGFQI
jgi:hypothetical protein